MRNVRRAFALRVGTLDIARSVRASTEDPIRRAREVSKHLFGKDMEPPFGLLGRDNELGSFLMEAGVFPAIWSCAISGI